MSLQRFFTDFRRRRIYLRLITAAQLASLSVPLYA